MHEERDENEKALADAVSRVRVFVVQQVQAGKRADALSFALALIATEMCLHVTLERNPLGVVRTALHSRYGDIHGRRGPDASSETGVALPLGTGAVPKDTVVH
jgi:hypothetical protein